MNEPLTVALTIDQWDRILWALECMDGIDDCGVTDEDRVVMYSAHRTITDSITVSA